MRKVQFFSLWQPTPPLRGTPPRRGMACTERGKIPLLGGVPSEATRAKRLTEGRWGGSNPDEENEGGTG